MNQNLNYDVTMKSPIHIINLVDYGFSSGKAYEKDNLPTSYNLYIYLQLVPCIFFQQMVEDPLQLLRIKCVADEQGDGVLGRLFNEFSMLTQTANHFNQQWLKQLRFDQ